MRKWMINMLCSYFELSCIYVAIYDIDTLLLGQLLVGKQMFCPICVYWPILVMQHFNINIKGAALNVSFLYSSKVYRIVACLDQAAVIMASLWKKFRDYQHDTNVITCPALCSLSRYSYKL